MARPISSPSWRAVTFAYRLPAVSRTVISLVVKSMIEVYPMEEETPLPPFKRSTLSCDVAAAAICAGKPGFGLISIL